MNILTSKLVFKIWILVSESNVRNMESPIRPLIQKYTSMKERGCHVQFYLKPLTAKTALTLFEVSFFVW